MQRERVEAHGLLELPTCGQPGGTMPTRDCSKEAEAESLNTS